MRTVLDVGSAAFMLLGCMTCLVAAIGLNTVTDAYARLHVQTKATTFAILLTALGAALRMPHWSDVFKLALVVALQFWTTPIGSHLLGRAARSTGLRPAEPLLVDEEPAPTTGGDRAIVRRSSARDSPTSRRRGAAEPGDR